MASFVLTLLRLLRALARKGRDPEFRNILALVLILIASGTVFYSSVEGWHWFDALYFCVVTLATVGYGDLSPQTTLGKAFTIVYIFVGLGLFVAIVHDLSDGLITMRKERRERRHRKGRDPQ